MDKRFPENYPAKGGKTTNFEIPKWMFERELLEYEASKEKYEKEDYYNDLIKLINLNTILILNSV